MPQRWMRTWPEKHPDWEYRIYDNEFLMKFPFRNWKLINEYFWRGEYAGVQDLMRYEILYKFGGFMADADSICLHPVDELLVGEGSYTVYDRTDTEKAGVSPFLAAEPGNPVLGEVIERLAQLRPWELGKPWRSTGNRFLIQVIREIGMEKVTIWPSHYFIPWHHSDPKNVYSGPDRVYAEQQWGTTRHVYNSTDVALEARKTRVEVNAAAAQLKRELAKKILSEMKSECLETQSEDPAVEAADQNMAVWATLSESQGWKTDIKDLNETLSEALVRAGLPPRVESEPFYAFRQKSDLPGCQMIVKTEALRCRLAAWMSRASSVVQIGTGGGHLALLQKSLRPEARVVTVDPGGRTSDRHADAAKHYSHAAVQWLNGRFDGSVLGLIGRPGATLTRFAQAYPKFRADLLHISGITPTFLGAYGAGIEMLKPGGHILINHTRTDQLRERIQQLQMVGEVSVPLDYADFGLRAGAFAVLRRRPQS